MRKSIAACTLLLAIITVAPAARAEDDEVEPPRETTIQTAHTNVNVIEGAAGKEKTLDVKIVAEPSPAGEYAVDYEVVAQTATRGTDFDALIGRGELLVNGEDASPTIPVKIKGDPIDEKNETVRIELFNQRCVSQTSDCDLNNDPPLPGYVTIADDDGDETADPEIELFNGFADSDVDDVCAVEVFLEYGSAENVQVDFETEDLEAERNDDYEKTEGTMVLSPGQIRKSLNVEINRDREVERRYERFVVKFSNAKGGTLLEDEAVCSIKGTDPRARRQQRRRGGP
jgi:hypothetical protein